MVRIELVGLEFYAHHGVYPAERADGNRFEVDVTVDTNAITTVDSDVLADTVNYEQLYEIVEKEMKSPSNLLEHVAGRICDTILETIDLTEEVKIRVSKQNPPIAGKCKESAVTVTKRKQ